MIGDRTIGTDGDTYVKVTPEKLDHCKGCCFQGNCTSSYLGLDGCCPIVIGSCPSPHLHIYKRIPKPKRNK